MASLLESHLSTSTIRKLQDRRSYMAKAPYQKHKSKRRYVVDVALKFCPVMWFGPAIIRAHDKHEYQKDRQYVQKVYVDYQEHRSRDNSCYGTSGGGSIVDLRTYPTPIESPPCEDAEYDPWWHQWSGASEDPWQLPPANEIV